jgi:hypothetical protein
MYRERPNPGQERNAACIQNQMPYLQCSLPPFAPVPPTPSTAEAAPPYIREALPGEAKASPAPALDNQTHSMYSIKLNECDLEKPGRRASQVQRAPPWKRIFEHPSPGQAGVMITKMRGAGAHRCKIFPTRSLTRGGLYDKTEMGMGSGHRRRGFPFAGHALFFK